MATSTLKQFIGAVIRHCDDPLYFSLSDSRVAELTMNEIDLINNDLNLTGRPWNYSSFNLTVQPNEDYHAITEVADFTVPFSVETSNPNNPAHVVRVLILDDPTDAVRFSHAGTLAAPGVMHTAQSVAFTEHPEQPGLRAARFAPKPNAQASYKVLYVPNIVRPQALTDSVVRFPQFENYLLTRVVLAALPYCEWEGLDGEANAAKRKALQGDPQMPGSHAFRFIELNAQFTRQRRQSHQNHGIRIVPFGRLGARRR